MENSGRTMKPGTFGTEDLKRFLLGDADPAMRSDIELWLISDDDALDLISAAEDDIVDDFLDGSLSADDKRRFESHFLNAPERHQKLSFARGLRSHLRRAAAPAMAEPRTRKPLFDFRRPALSYALAALSLLLAAGIAWTAARLDRTRGELASAAAQITAGENERSRIDQELRQSETSNAALNAEVQRLQSDVTESVTQKAATLLAMTLAPSPRVRSGSAEDAQAVELGDGTVLAQFALPIPSNRYPTYRFDLTDENEKPVTTGDQIVSRRSADGLTVPAAVAASILKPGLYTITLSGNPPDGPAEEINRFIFRVIRR